MGFLLHANKQYETKFGLNIIYRNVVKEGMCAR
jgi:hypothetical protein